METLEEKIRRVTGEDVTVVPYDPAWPRMFAEERGRLLESLPSGLIRRIEHFGSTAVPGLAAKPVIDLLVEVSSLEQTRACIVPVLERQGCDCFWRPTSGDDVPPWYVWCIRRDASGIRTHHMHMVEHDFPHWERLLFRDYLIAHPAVAGEYAALKYSLCQAYPRDRIAYTNGKTEFITRVTALAREWGGGRP